MYQEYELDPQVRFWKFSEDLQTFTKWSRIVMRFDMGIKNWQELGVAERELRRTHMFPRRPIRRPDDFPRPALALPDDGFAPDYLWFDCKHICSARVRDALSQPADTVQYGPLNLVSEGGAAALAQDYRIMHVLAQQPAMDLTRSRYRLELVANGADGKSYRRFSDIERFCVPQDLIADTEVFLVDELPTVLLVSDTVAERLMQARCTGIEMVDPALLDDRLTLVRYRTANGIGTRTRWI